MRPSEAHAHLVTLLKRLEQAEAQMQLAHGDAVPRSTRAFDRKTIEALKHYCPPEKVAMKIQPETGSSPTSPEGEDPYLKGISERVVRS